MNLKSGFSLFQDYYKSVKRALIFYGVFYYILNLITIVSTLFTGIIASVFLAGASKFYPEGVENPYVTYLNDNSNYVILTYLINAALALLSGIISFFAINKRFGEVKVTFGKLKIEHMLYTSGDLHYKELNQREKEYRLYRRCIQIVNIDRYRSENILNNKLSLVDQDND
ncbi:DUF4231 domain-containing protein [Mycoplasmopsis alligatoris]|uniref:DUF4231 domain-containing protein n=1 Tax=Mycoplasmopsis alligatoris A21JP2 TaxID=747682 RepID=D4XWM2_9BACT|nr:DUF4231 domain-containing protein [Mycoplasmopsis alligatoris]EFF41206.1 conserved hypothetical protein [Mycoplasmopsis alligatoris A21JP2]